MRLLSELLPFGLIRSADDGDHTFARNFTPRISEGAVHGENRAAQLGSSKWVSIQATLYKNGRHQSNNKDVTFM